MSVFASFAIPPYAWVAAPIVGLAVGVGIYEYKKHKATAAAASATSTGPATATGPATKPVGVKAPIGLGAPVALGNLGIMPAQSVPGPGGVSLPVLGSGVVLKPVSTKSSVSLPTLNGGSVPAVISQLIASLPVCSAQRQRLLAAYGLPPDQNCPPPAAQNYGLMAPAVYAAQQILANLSPTDANGVNIQVCILGFTTNPSATTLSAAVQCLNGISSAAAASAAQTLGNFLSQSSQSPYVRKTTK